VCCIRNCLIVRSADHWRAESESSSHSKKLILDVRLDGHRHHEVYSVFTPSIYLSSLLCTTFEYCMPPAQTTYIGPPLCRRARTHEFKLQRSYKGLQQASRLCERGAILITTVHIQSQVIFPVSHYTQFGKNCQETLL